MTQTPEGCRSFPTGKPNILIQKGPIYPLTNLFSPPASPTQEWQCPHPFLICQALCQVLKTPLGKIGKSPLSWSLCPNKQGCKTITEYDMGRAGGRQDDVTNGDQGRTLSVGKVSLSLEHLSCDLRSKEGHSGGRTGKCNSPEVG